MIEILYRTMPGKDRRKAFLKWLDGETGNVEIPVNRRYCLPETDSDLQYFLEKGICKRVRNGFGPTSKGTYFVFKGGL